MPENTFRYKAPKARKRKYSSNVSPSGKLLRRFGVSAYCDTSFLFDYWNSSAHDPNFTSFPSNREDPITDKLAYYLKHDRRTKKVFEIRRLFDDFDAGLSLVYTPACRLELEEIMTQASFQHEAALVAGAKYVSNQGRKWVGERLGEILSDFSKNQEDEELKQLYHGFFHMTSFAGEGLVGLVEVDILNLSITQKDFYRIGFLANLQLGLADIVHLLATERLGCKYFFTFDNDFARASSQIKEYLGFEIVTDPSLMLRLVRAGNKK